MAENERNLGLTAKQAKAIEHLLTCASLGEAAEAAGVAESTLRRWRKEPEFSQAFTDARSLLLDATLTKLQQRCSDAIETLSDVMTPGNPAPARVSAARSVLEMCLRVREASETDERLRTIEETLQAAQSAGLLKGVICPT